MKKQTTTKIISGLIIFIFIFSLVQITPSVQAAASLSNTYANPNQSNGKNPYKFKVSDVVNSSVLTSVVGCTGVVDKVSSWMMKIVNGPKKVAQATLDKTRDQLKATCSSIKAGAEGGVGAIPQVNDLVTATKTSLEKLKIGGQAACEQAVAATDDAAIKKINETNDNLQAAKFKESCFDGIAITLAKNQLTAMTRSAMNWVNSGYGGNPLFVQNMQRLTTNIERNVIETGTNVLLDKAFGNDYAYNFAKSTITTARSGRGLVSGSSDFLSGLQSDLGAFISDPKSYYTTDAKGNAQDTRTALQRSRDANRAFQNDFSTGGWDAWMALTQRDQNNPLGFSMLASQYLADTQQRQITEVTNEKAENGGFLSQKTCIKWQEYNEFGKPKTVTADLVVGGEIVSNQSKFVYNNKGPTNDLNHCVDWKIVTPGSLIKDKTTAYLNSPERQLELAKTINDSLNALFGMLISKLTSNGLSGLSDSVANTTNWTDSINEIPVSNDGSSYDNNGAYDNFNLTRDLGNTYIHDTITYLGTWNASTNLVENSPFKDIIKNTLYPNTVPIAYDANGKQLPGQGSNVYFTVTTAGKTKLLNEGYNSWEIGDRAFWDGSAWQNWKCGATSPNWDGACKTGTQSNPIKRRGVIQIQSDYIVAATEALKILPSVMPKLGELDYCLPGPNPSYKANSTEAQGAYQDWFGSAFVGPIDNTNQRFGVKIDGPGELTYENLHNVYLDNPKVWENLLKLWLSTNNLIWRFTHVWNGHAGSYIYSKSGSLNRDENGAIQQRTNQKEMLTDYINSEMFQNFYNAFDKMMSTLYFNNVTSKYLEKEDAVIDISKDQNPSYMPSASAGYDLTKDIISYSEDIKQATQDYKDYISQAKTNISKLEAIKTEVSAIIVAAQERRNTKLLLQINKEGGATKDRTAICDSYLANCSGTECQTTYKDCIGSVGKNLTIDLYKKIYSSCLAEENIQVYDVNEIMGTHTDPERCFNGIDDDLNGLIDSKDPACANAVPPSRPNITVTPAEKYKCEMDPISQTTLEGFTQNEPCINRLTEATCVEEPYYPNNNGAGYSGSYNSCQWVLENTPSVNNPYNQNNPNSVDSVCMLNTAVDPTNFVGQPTNQEEVLCSNRTAQACTTNSYVGAQDIYGARAEHKCTMGTPQAIKDISLYGCSIDLYTSVSTSSVTPTSNISCFARPPIYCTVNNFKPANSNYVYACRLN